MNIKQSALDARLRDALKSRGFTKQTVAVLFHVRAMLATAIALTVIKLMESAETSQLLQAEVKKRDLRILELEESLCLLQSRMSRIEARHRSRYTPEERYKILVHKATYLLSFEQAAELFLINVQTVKHWFNEAVKEPTKKTVGSLLKAVPPLMRYSDVTRNLVCLMDKMGFGGCKRVAQTLTRAGMKLSRETVRRHRKQPRKPDPRPDSKIIERVLRAKSPDHIWMMDITEIPSAFRLFTFKFVVLLDVFSRFPIAAKLFFKEPTAAEMSGIIKAAVKKHGRPKHYISDQGPQFTSDHFRATLKRQGIKQRFGAIGKYGSISIIERFWRTLKDLLILRSRRAWSPSELVRRLDAGMYYYAFHKPHQGLDGATPAEVYFGMKPACAHAKRPLREFELKRPGSKESDNRLFEIAYFDPEHLLPVLVPMKKAA